MLPIFDGHCDVLFRLDDDPNLSFNKENGLHSSAPLLRKGGAKIQCFALYVGEGISEESKFSNVLHMIDIFFNQVIEPNPDMVLVRTKQEINELQDHQIGAMLTLEGCDAIGHDIIKLRTLFRLGIRSVGLTWNHANACADGALEPRGGGLTRFGFEVVKENNRHKVMTDVSHLSERSFWDVIEAAQFPTASHSNVKRLCEHPRNLTNEQISALFTRDGFIGVTFVPKFLTTQAEASISDILRHIDYLCELGGVSHIGFGSDFDGIDKTPKDLTNYGDYPKLVETLLKHYSEEQVKGFLFKNFYDCLPV
ncbi:membrane dipeptidase [Terrilactibacillus sp. BCM23-1]|uniref:Membrane dipeptidase n=1 Tax=Terrilactibacillus tamarindi TaxID=2599694 RepID=A0A6N8CUT2_9BACI|nr:dipeptidase [Terrilactibacillus tamarindi]MTT32885.1 membrane dipeptidase [Terrilactibacillus tamarindi]